MNYVSSLRTSEKFILTIKTKTMNTKKTNYQGWTNYATWRINLELFEGYMLDELHERLTTYELSEYLREYAEEIVTMDESGELCVSYALAFLAQVNYYEIAEHLLQDYILTKQD